MLTGKLKKKPTVQAKGIAEKFSCYYSAKLKQTSYAYLKNPDYPKATKSWTSCFYYIEAPRGSTVTMECEKDTFYTHTSCR